MTTVRDIVEAWDLYCQLGYETCGPLKYDLDAEVIIKPPIVAADETTKSCVSCGWNYYNRCGSYLVRRTICLNDEHWRPELVFEDYRQRYEYIESWLPGAFYDAYSVADLTLRSADKFIERMENNMEVGRWVMVTRRVEGDKV